MGFPGGSVSKESTWNAGDCLQFIDPGSIPGFGGSPGEGNSLLYSCLGNPMDRRTWKATVHGVARGRHTLVTKPQPQDSMSMMKKYKATY